MKYFLIIDAGTSSVRAILFDTNGVQIDVSQQTWEHISIDGVSNSMGFDFEKNWGLITRCIKNVIKSSAIDSKSIVAISATSMREGIVLFDKNGNPIWAVANIDARASVEIAQIEQNYENVEKEFYDISGQTFALGALPRLLWLKNNSREIYDRVDKICMISDWILAKLCNVIGVEPSNAGTTGIFSLKQRDWQTFMANKIGIKDDIFPPCYESGTILGTITEDMASELSLYQDCKVVSGGGDTQMGAVGLGAIKIGQTAIIGGSFWQQVVNISHKTKPPEDMSIRVNPHIVSNQSQAEGITFFSGIIMQWFIDTFCKFEKNEAKQKGISIFKLLEEQSKDVPIGSYGIVPIFSDSMKYGKWYHASPSFLNLSLDTNRCNIASMFKSIQENSCIVSSINLDKIQKFTGIKIEEIIFAGGASNANIYPQILADTTGCVVKIPKITEATALGTAIVAGVGVGVYKNLEDGIKRVVKEDRKYYPNMDNHKKYIKLKDRWESIYKQQLKLVDQKLVESMWMAPGLNLA